MSYETFISCDGDCGKRVQVPAPGNLPNGWVIIGYPKVTLDSKRLQPGGVQMAQQAFCGWRCAHKFVKGFLQKGDDVIDTKALAGQA